IGLCLLTSIGSWGMPQMIQKFYGVADKKGIKAGTVISTLFAFIISVGAYFVGSLSRMFFTEVPTGGYDHIIPLMLEKALPAALLGIVLVLVLSASVSTLSGITLTSCSTISLDLVSATSKKEFPKKKTLLLTRILCFLFILLSFIIASSKTPILLLMSFSWGTISGSFLAPYLLGLWWKGMNKGGAISGMVTGLTVSILLAVISKFNAGNAPLYGVIAMASSFIACFIGSKLSKNQDNSHFYDENYTLQK
ncbi:MAG: sodium:solute symporter family protein, partial [Oscillospiraceae bacterium]